MNRPRMIPVLLLQNGVLVKSVGFQKHRYIGDPINAVRIFNELQADELIFLDISARKAGRCMSADLIKEVGEEAHMPFAVGGGFSTLQEVEKAIALGAEKVVLNTTAWQSPSLVRECARSLGSSSVAVCMDVQRNWLGKSFCAIHNGSRKVSGALNDLARQMEDAGAGELIVQSIPRDGTAQGYDLDLVHQIAQVVGIPVVALGGAGSVQDMWAAYEKGASAMAAGTFYVFHGRKKGVLLSYPTH